MATGIVQKSCKALFPMWSLYFHCESLTQKVEYFEESVLNSFMIGPITIHLSTDVTFFFVCWNLLINLKLLSELNYPTFPKPV